MKHRAGFSTLAICVCALGVLRAADDWPHWRGPRASGVSSEPSLPTKWSATENVAWKAPLGGAGISTPIVSGDRVLRDLAARHAASAGRGLAWCRGVTPRRWGSARWAAPRPADPSKTVFVVEAFSRSTGARVWERRIDAEGALTPDPRKAQPRDAQPGDRRQAGLRAVRHRADRRAQPGRRSPGSGISARTTRRSTSSGATAARRSSTTTP